MIPIDIYKRNATHSAVSDRIPRIYKDREGNPVSNERVLENTVKRTEGGLNGYYTLKVPLIHIRSSQRITAADLGLMCQLIGGCRLYLIAALMVNFHCPTLKHKSGISRTTLTLWHKGEEAES